MAVAGILLLGTMPLWIWFSGWIRCTACDYNDSSTDDETGRQTQNQEFDQVQRPTQLPTQLPTYQEIGIGVLPSSIHKTYTVVSPNKRASKFYEIESNKGIIPIRKS